MKLVILDRDGVINHDSNSYIKSPEEFRPIKNSLEAIVRLNFAGFIVAVATNQSGIARGLFDNYTLHSIHRKMEDLLSELGGRIDAVFYCPHAKDDQCNCRKPRSGMILDILSGFNVEAKNTIIIGDSLRDIEAGKGAGVNKLMLVKTGKGNKTMIDPSLPPKTQIYPNLSVAVDEIIKNN